MKNNILFKQKFISRLSILFALLLISASSFAQNLKVATAANLQGIIKVLGDDFTKKTGIGIDPIVGSSGNLVAQIKNGAPFDVFLSADMSFPKNLFADGFTLQKPVVYASGSLIICSTQNLGFENWERLLLTGRVKKIAIANPTIAPYGKAAEESLQKKGILSEIKSKAVYGESISQVNTYITTGSVDVGFTTQALIKDSKTTLYYKVIDPKTYSPIEQGMVILKHAQGNANAEKFYQYILSAEAKRIFKEYGYYVQ
ncbi:molybdate transport system substrate-binding protein [Mucilaginibacter mallensis]|uniref:Molybdate transport system substrate-binding protein n=1 Tax=Mucilaginibacter mallensis TaxID=652787 RepID=A0A1H2BU26_MUCMA|nr:molybdate ABC transporter substrate-binding protein [Mucilaginibacter mallensis]SDT61266.1 molybdate transport system substrate-binding protein [Mucilaginibacter mallensis]